jgi:hypothetical protein
MAALLATTAAALPIAACGSSGSAGAGGAAASTNPQTLLQQTFASSHDVKSGVLHFSLVVTPTGSSEITTPLSLSLAGRFQSRGTGKVPESAFTIGFSGLGKQGSFGVTTTAAHAYITIEHASYRLPAADFTKLRSSLASSSSSGSAPGLSSLGIDPERWLSQPQIVGTQTIDGVVTEHLHAGVNVAAFVHSLNAVLAKERSTLGAATGASTHISALTARKIGAAIRNPTVDVWTGKSDTMLRRMVIAATVPVSGATSAELGGLRSAAFRMTIGYSQLGTPQAISAPSDVHSYAQLQTKLAAIGTGLQSELGGVGSAAGTTGASRSSSRRVSKYARCINSAHDDVTKMQKCASLLNSGG